MTYYGLHYRVCEEIVRPEMAFNVLNIAFPHISFEILFCQNKIKKICKLVPKVFLKRNQEQEKECDTGSISEAIGQINIINVSSQLSNARFKIKYATTHIIRLI